MEKLLCSVATQFSGSGFTKNERVSSVHSQCYWERFRRSDRRKFSDTHNEVLYIVITWFSRSVVCESPNEIQTHTPRQEQTFSRRRQNQTCAPLFGIEWIYICSLSSIRCGFLFIFCFGWLQKYASIAQSRRRFCGRTCRHNIFKYSRNQRTKHNVCWVFWRFADRLFVNGRVNARWHD